jgi:hypothetical protein
MAFAAIIASCATRSDKPKDEGEIEEEKAEQADQKEWKEMDDFHMVMAETFHPYKDSTNLAPAKSKASELASSAEQWATSTLPEKVNNAEMKQKLDELRKETMSFSQNVSSADDKTIGEQLTKIHDLFHSIQEDWYGGGHHH